MEKGKENRILMTSREKGGEGPSGGADPESGESGRSLTKNKYENVITKPIKSAIIVLMK